MSTPLIPPRSRSRTPDPFQAHVIPPPIDPQLIQLAETRGKQTALLEELKRNAQDITEHQYELQMLMTAHIQNVNQQFAVMSSIIKDINDRLETGKDQIAKQKADNKRDFYTKIVTLLTTILAVVLTLLKVWSDVPTYDKKDKKAKNTEETQQTE
jgi:hypothetical protein